MCSSWNVKYDEERRFDNARDDRVDGTRQRRRVDLGSSTLCICYTRVRFRVDENKTSQTNRRREKESDRGEIDGTTEKGFVVL